MEKILHSKVGFDLLLKEATDVKAEQFQVLEFSFQMRINKKIQKKDDWKHVLTVDQWHLGFVK